MDREAIKNAPVFTDIRALVQHIQDQTQASMIEAIELARYACDPAPTAAKLVSMLVAQEMRTADLYAVVRRNARILHSLQDKVNVEEQTDAMRALMHGPGLAPLMQAAEFMGLAPTRQWKRPIPLVAEGEAPPPAKVRKVATTPSSSSSCSNSPWMGWNPPPKEAPALPWMATLSIPKEDPSTPTSSRVGPADTRRANKPGGVKSASFLAFEAMVIETALPLINIHPPRAKEMEPLPYSCMVPGCIMKTHTLQHLRAHYFQHKAGLRYLCPVKGCVIMVQTKRGILIHMGCAHPEESQRDFKAIAMDSTDASDASPTNTAIQSPRTEPTVQKYQCTVSGCGNVYTSKLRLKTHFCKHITNTYMCPVEGCALFFTSLLATQAHINEKHTASLPLDHTQPRIEAPTVAWIQVDDA